MGEEEQPLGDEDPGHIQEESQEMEAVPSGRLTRIEETDENEGV